MDGIRKIELIVMLSILTMVLIVSFWTIWYIFTGNVPDSIPLGMISEDTVILPFASSRWWDILLGPFYSVIFILLFTSKTIRENEDMNASLSAGLVPGLLCGFCADLFIILDSLGVALTPGNRVDVNETVYMMIGASGLVACWFVYEEDGPIASLLAGVSATTSASLVFGLFAGLNNSLDAVLFGGLSSMMGFGIGFCQKAGLGSLLVLFAGLYVLYLILISILHVGLVVGLILVLIYIVRKFKRFLYPKY